MAAGTLGGGDQLARGARKATFAAGDRSGAIELKNVAPEGSREEFVPVEIDRTRKVKKLTPKRDWILVQRRDPEEITVGGLYVPETSKSQDRPAEGVIKAIGKRVEDLAVGDHIIFGKYAGTEYPWGSETLLFMREEEVISVIEE